MIIHINVIEEAKRLPMNDAINLLIHETYCQEKRLDEMEIKISSLIDEIRILRDLVNGGQENNV